ncbi:ribonuclease [Paenibacillus swuensis]|uniref:Ribonuclease n=1 Tax=Paenibacillus swuensis TaxID=1178515 RepID=A0A172TJE6_9BACL|nr:Rne/Rng family ribonuclease [Paenibacillus swuensis]ANE47175.1 ribonuclease [Paenibacillus swuensis]
MNEIVVHCGENQTEVALLENGMLAEYYVERPSGRTVAGNIYRARVVNVLPGMQAAFVDIGLRKNAFLYVDDLLDPHLEKQPKRKPSITELVKEGDELIVQVTKEPSGSKGARVTTHYALPGRCLVYMPYADYVGVSRKLSSEAERNRLKNLGEMLRQPGEGVILRTAAEGVTEELVAQDLSFLRKLWSSIQLRKGEGVVPSELYGELDIVPRLVRDAFTENVNLMIIDHPVKCAEIVGLLQGFAPELASRVRKVPAEQIRQRLSAAEREYERMIQRKVGLANGGYLVIDQTEALTVIDVNTGKYIGNDSLELTVFDTNLEAAREIARLLRLRDIGGIVIIDFIDMEQDKHREEVLKRLELTMKKDRSKHHVVGWTKLGLIELTRRKIRENHSHGNNVPCPVCKGSGKHTVRERRG